ncbi:MAG: ABC transporter ATP-binding protein [bacterium]|nr:ABC transporter ATP-binding protein [bacterium]
MEKHSANSAAVFDQNGIGKKNCNTVLKTEQLFFSYGNYVVLQDISFTVCAGTICGLIGPNGSGKTTLIKCVNGLLKPGKGHIMIDHLKVSGMPRKKAARLMAVVPQRTTVIFSFTALQMVVMGRAPVFGRMHVPGPQDYIEAHHILEELSMGHLSGRLFNELSGGEQQMVLIGRALFQDPKILLLDEPTTHLDFKNQFMIMELIKDITRKKNLVTLVALHDPNLALRYCDMITFLKNGRIVLEGPSQSVFNSETLASVYDMAVAVENLSGGFKVIVPGKKNK